IAEGEVPVGKTIGVIGEHGEEFQIAEPVAQPPVRDSGPGEGGRGNREVPPAAEKAPKAPAARRGPVKASPPARRSAPQRGIGLATVRGTGQEGRIVAEDVERSEAAPAAAPAPVPAGEVERRELTGIRRTIAKRLTEAWTIPVFQLEASVDMTRANALVERLRAAGQKVTVTDVLVKTSAAALMQHREVNAERTDDAILIHPSANVGIAVAAPQGP